jgi:molybdopterin molybdotransferase
VIDDVAESVTAMLAAAARRADLVITTGGVSAGAYDTVKEVLRELGTVRFDKVGMQPGMPQGFGTLGDGTPIFTLPGNPVSALVSFEIFVRPALLRMAGETVLEHPAVTATAAVDWTSPPGKRQFVRAQLSGPAGALQVRPVGGQGSHLVADLAEATCLAVVADDVTQVRAGDPLPCLVLDPRGRW